MVSNFVDIPEKNTPEYIEYHQMTTDIADALNGVSAEDRQAFFADANSIIGNDVQSALEGYGVTLDDDVMANATDLLADMMAEDSALKAKINNPTQEITAEDIEAFLERLNQGN